MIAAIMAVVRRCFLMVGILLAGTADCLPFAGDPADTIATAQAITFLPAVAFGSTERYNNTYSPQGCTGDPISSHAPDVVYSYTPTETKMVYMSLCGTAFDAIVYLVDGNGMPVVPAGSLTAACYVADAGGDCDDAESVLAVVLTAGVKYYIVIDGVGTSSGRFKLSIYEADSAHSDTYARILDRGILRCAALTHEKGFFNDVAGQTLAGFNIDLCRALAAAVFGRNGDIDALITYQTVLPSSDRAELVNNGAVDVVILPSTITLGRDWTWGVFSTPTFFDGQSFVVNETAIASVVDTPIGQLALSELNRADVSYCVVADAYLEQACALFNLPDAVQVLVEDRDGGLEALATGRCMALTGPGSWLTAALPRANLAVLTDVLSREAYGVLTAHNSPVWSSIVQWVLHGLVLAESLGITRANAATIQPTQLEGRLLLGRVPPELLTRLEAQLGAPWNAAPLPLDRSFMENALLQVGNYGEIFARNLPAGGTPRANTPNALWTSSRGALYPYLFLGETGEISQVAQAPPNRRLTNIQLRGKLICGALRHEQSVFSKPASGSAPAGGMDVDLCRAVAAAIFNRSDSIDDVVELKALSLLERRSALHNGSVDVLIHELTPTLGRDVAWGFSFSVPYFYDSQAFLVDTSTLVPSSSGSLQLADIDRNGSTCCVVAGSTSGLVASSLLRNAAVVQVAHRDEGIEGIRSGRCTALSSDRGNLELAAGGNLDFIPVTTEAERVALRVPLAAAVVDGETDLLHVVNWVIQGLIAAEDEGISQSSVGQREPTQWEGRLLMGLEGKAPAGLPIARDFMKYVIRAVGNYGA
eukprot:jgi/Mesvir1/6183/Mv00870-RA.3